MRLIYVISASVSFAFASPANAVVFGRLAPGETIQLSSAPGPEIGESGSYVMWATFWADNSNEPAAFRHILMLEYQWFQYGWDFYMDPPQVVTKNSANGFGTITAYSGLATKKRTYRTDYALGTIDGRDADGAGEYYWNKVWNEYVINKGSTYLNYQISYATNVPEPAAWSMMLAGFGFAGFSLRVGQKRRALSS